MHQLLFGGGRQRAGHLKGEPERLGRWEGAVAADVGLDGFAADELHDVEPVVLIGAEVEHRGDVGVAQGRGGPGFA